MIRWDIEREVVKYVSQLGSKWVPAIYLDEEPWRSLKEQILGGGDEGYFRHFVFEVPMRHPSRG